MKGCILVDMKNEGQPTIPGLFRFFIPLGLSASLSIVSHLIINGTLARSPDPETAIAGFSLAMSFFIILERVSNILRQTSSALVRDEISFQTVQKVTYQTLFVIFLLSAFFVYSPFGEWLLRNVLQVADSLIANSLEVYQILMWVTLVSVVRCLFQGVIIARL